MTLSFDYPSVQVGELSSRLPSGKRLQKTMERSTVFNGKIHYKWPFSIAMLNYQRVGIPEFEGESDSHVALSCFEGEYIC